ncbi:MAG: hypothetical protein AAGD10_07975 [Myxococcota bacterium]
MRVLCLILLLSSACREAKPTRSARLYFTSEFQGRVAPSDQEGGLARLVSVLKRDSGPRWMDLGDLLAPNSTPAQARVLARPLSSHALALNLGPHELEQASLLRTLRREVAPPWLSANARPVDEWALARSFVRLVDGVRIGITGVVLPEGIETRDFVLLAHEPALANEVHALEDAGAEVFILLARLERRQAQVLAEVAPTLDFIIYGADRAETAEPTRHGDTWLIHAGGRGRAVGVLNISVHASHGAFDRGEGSLGTANSFQVELLPLDARIPQDPGVSIRLESGAQSQ